MPIWNIPFPRNALFTGREDILSLLHTQLQTGLTAASSQPQAISGLGGIGKTQIVVEYAYLHSQDYQSVFWVRADTHDNLVSGYMEIAQLLNLPQKDEQDQALVVKAVLQWFKTKTQWLLILDNADELTVVREFLPPFFGGHILLTTRAHSIGQLARRLEVTKMAEDIGALLLLRRAGLIAQDALLETASASDIALAKEITEELDGLPLALDQAGAYIEETGCSLIDYSELYQAQGIELLRERGRLVFDHPDPVATTWSLSFAKVEQVDPAAAELLRFCAFLHPDAIPEEMIFFGAAHLGPILGPAASNKFALNKMMASLYAFSLVRRHIETRTFSIHRLVQSVLRNQMDQTLARQWIERAMLALNIVFPRSGERQTFSEALRDFFLKEKGQQEYTLNDLYARYLHHVLSCARWVLQEEIASQESADLLYRVGILLNDLATVYWDRGEYDDAERWLLTAFDMNKRNIGLKFPTTTSIIINLTAVYYKRGRYTEAEQLLLWILSFQEQLLEDGQAIILNNLAIVYLEQNKQVEVESLLLRALTICKKHLELRNRRYMEYVAICFNNLATFYLDQSKYTEAKPLLQQALAIYQQLFGLKYQITCTILKNYVFFLRKVELEASAVELGTLLNSLTKPRTEELSMQLVFYPLAFDFHLDQFVSYNASDHLTFHVEAFQQTIQEALPRLLHFFRLVLRDCDYEATIFGPESDSGAFRESKSSYNDLSWGDVLFAYETVNRKAFWKTEEQSIAWLWTDDGRHVIDWSKFNSTKYRTLLMKQWVMRMIVELIYEYYSSEVSAPIMRGKGYESLRTKIVEAVGGIPRDILSSKHSALNKKPSTYLFNQRDLRWFRHMIGLEHFSIYTKYRMKLYYSEDEQMKRSFRSFFLRALEK